LAERGTVRDPLAHRPGVRQGVRVRQLVDDRIDRAGHGQPFERRGRLPSVLGVGDQRPERGNGLVTSQVGEGVDRQGPCGR